MEPGTDSAFILKVLLPLSLNALNLSSLLHYYTNTLIYY